MSSERDRALALIEREDRTNAERVEREREQATEGRIQQAIRRVRQQDRQIEQERARRDAAAEAEALSHELHDRGVKLQQFAEGLHSLIAGYVDTRSRLQDAKRRAGQDTGGRWGRANSVLVPWFRSVFGGHDSVVGVEHELAGTGGRGRDRGYRTLPERDPLSRAGEGPDAA